jgi:adenine-specific DNA methylase
MIPKICKRLAEVDFPIAEVGRHALAEKARRMGTPHQLHLWWAWRPLAACRSMLLALLLPDPCDSNCPSDFKETARQILPQVVGQTGESDIVLQKALFKFIANFSNYELSQNQLHINVARNLVKAAHGTMAPLVVDPFSGGGSIPLEAIRLGCDAFAGDLNPVACLILKTKLEDIPRIGSEVNEKIIELGSSVLNSARAECGDLYPEDANGTKPIAYIWARTIKCESPNCGAEIPLVRSFWLSKKPNFQRALRYSVIKTKDDPPQLRIEVFCPKKSTDVPDATIVRANAKCAACGAVLQAERVRAQIANQNGGADVIFDEHERRVGGARLLAVVGINSKTTGRHYRESKQEDYVPIWESQKRLEAIIKTWKMNDQDIYPVPNELLPPIGTLGFRVQRYGMLQWSNLFTSRQLVTLAVLARQIAQIKDSKVADLVALSLSKLAERNNTICDWMVGVECPGHIFTQQVVPPAWDFAEAAPLGESSGAFTLTLEHTASSASTCLIPGGSNSADVHQLDAAELPLPDESASIFFTDPPYYDAVPYSDLSDFFFVWLKRALPRNSLLRDQFDPNNTLTPKTREVVQDETKLFEGNPKDRRFFESRMASAFQRGRKILQSNGIGCVVFAHKTTEGWEALLSGIISGGWVITGSWPISTERSARMRARESAALESSVHLICRPRSVEAPVGDWGSVLRELPQRVGDWIERLQSEGIRGADLVFACIGPALEIFSRYSKVETADGKEVKLDQYLEKVWEVVGRTALELILGTAEARARNGLAGALEEDARLTALFLWTLQSTNGNGKAGATEEPDADESEAEDDEDTAPKGKTSGYSLVFDVVRRFAQPLGINLPIWEDRIIETKKGVVRLLSIGERAKGLFGEAGAQAVAHELERDPALAGQFEMALGIVEAAPKVRGSGRKMHHGSIVSDDDLSAKHGATTLDRVHAAMLLQGSGKTNALRALLKAEQQRSPDFLRLANALSALYPKNSEEKRLLDAMLLAAGR